METSAANYGNEVVAPRPSDIVKYLGQDLVGMAGTSDSTLGKARNGSGRP